MQHMYSEYEKNDSPTSQSLMPDTGLSADEIITYNERREEVHLTLMVLNEGHLEKVVKLQEEVISDLEKEGKKDFIIEKTEEEFKKLLNGTDGRTIGIFDNTSRKLVGKVSIKSKNNLKGVLCNSEEGAVRIWYNPPQLNCPEVDCIFEVSGIMTHPNYRGMGLAKKLNTFLINNIEFFSEFKNIILLQEVALKNEPNIHVLTVMGFKALQKYTASDGVECYLFYKPINKDLETSTKFNELESLAVRKSKTMGACLIC